LETFNYRHPEEKKKLMLDTIFSKFFEQIFSTILHIIIGLTLAHGSPGLNHNHIGKIIETITDQHRVIPYLLQQSVGHKNSSHSNLKILM
jgi:ABC-type methionine transport system permease subunit